MSKDELFLVLEALRSSLLEFETLIDDDIHIPSGRLTEQLEDALEIVEEEFENHADLN